MGVKNTSRYVKFAVYILVIALINVVGITLFTRMDLTGNKVYSLSGVSKDVVSTLSEPLTINVFFTKDLPAPYNTVERYLRDLLAEYSLYANNYFNYRFFDVSPEGEIGSEASMENRRLASDYGINPMQIQVFEEDEVKFKKAYMGLVIIHGDMVERLPTITTTDGLEYRLTSSIQKLNNKISTLLNLKDPVQVRLYLSTSLKQVAPYMGLNDLPELQERVKVIVNELGNRMYKKLSYSHVDPADVSEMESLVEKYNLMQLRWPALSEGKISAGEGIIGLVMEHGESSAVLPVLQVFRIPLFGTQYNLVQPEELEDMIEQSVESLIGINEDIGYIADHGTLQTFAMPGAQGQESISNFSDLVSRNYSLKNVNLKEKGIPEGLGCLIIARPTQGFSDYELYQIDQALMRGTNLALFLDAFEEILPASQPGNPYGQQPQYIPLNTGIEKLLDYYGIRIKKSIVLDEKSYKQRLPKQLGGGEQNIYFAPIIESSSINRDIDYMENIKGLITLKISPLQVDDKRIEENGIQAIRLFSSSEKSWEMRDGINLNPMLIRPPALDEERQSMPLAYILEGTFPSYFAGKPLPEMDVEEDKEKPEGKPEAGIDLSQIKGTGGFISRSQPTKIFLIASSEMIRNNLLDSQGQSPNSMFIMNILDVLNGHEDIAKMRSKILSFNPLEETTTHTKMFIKALNIAGLPVIVVIFGILVWMKRHLRKKHIDLMFQPRR